MSKRIVIVGGGVGGTMLANLLVGKLYPEVLRGDVSITLLSNSPDHYYKPAFMYVAFSQFFEEELKRPERSLLRPEISFHVEEVTRFDFSGQQLRTRTGKRFDYDFLVIATGCVPAPERIEGLQEAGDHFGVCGRSAADVALAGERIDAVRADLGAPGCGGGVAAPRQGAQSRIGAAPFGQDLGHQCDAGDEDHHGPCPHPLGNPELSPEAEKALRRELVERALTALSTPVDEQTVFNK